MRPFISLSPAILLTVALISGCATKPSGPVALFNGRNLDGWAEHSGKAKYTVDNGMLVGESVAGSGNSFLCTTRAYDNFDLELEYQCDPLLNSGVQIRSDLFPEARTLRVGGKEIKIPADRVHGYQVEIDMDSARGRMWTGGVYDEARRGWLFPADGEKGKQGAAFSEQGRRITKNGEWNKLRIVANGPSIKTWLNGELRSDITDTLTPRGLIALQVHGIGNDASKVGLKVSFRNIRLTPLCGNTGNTLTAAERKEGWRLLWDGQTTQGWRSARGEEFPAKGWTMHDGILTVNENKGQESAGGGDIITREKFSNFELKVDFRLTPGANSGIKYFVHPNLDPVTGTGAKASVGSAIGYEFQVLDDMLHPDAKLGHNGNRTLASLYDLLPAATTKKPNPIGEWNTAHIIVRGDHNEHWLNGVKVLEYDRTSPAFKAAFAESKFHNIQEFPTWADGHILLQEHGNEVSFRNVKIRPLDQK
ncbi:MAG: DUF1080 domain-containing protein [Verrucomicrobiota bacterium]